MCFKESFKIGVAFCFLRDTLNPIPTGHGLNQPIYSYHVTQAGRNRVKDVFIEGIDDLQVSAQAFLDRPDNVFGS